MEVEVIVWGGVTMTKRTELQIHQGIHQENVTDLYYRDNVIKPIVVPYAHWHWDVFIFQDDIARAHHACVVHDHQ